MKYEYRSYKLEFEIKIRGEGIFRKRGCQTKITNLNFGIILGCQMNNTTWAKLDCRTNNTTQTLKFRLPDKNYELGLWNYGFG
ncbi:hypothetical protein RCL_jg7129.t1 [Rhizophagus clarus]|uniref:Uncharacterized protein n=1 Tax=Rhizophagus clarus TaxID=94130 RepID=A0A8H3LYD1_9GLOM|nr:hypothetical protein RCL_jg7129.t1 [Rhizophagus clarus]